MVSHMVSVGEETGQLEHMLGKIADFYEAEVDAKVKALTSLIEPMMIIFVGGDRRLHRDLDVPADLRALRQDPLTPAEPVRRHQLICVSLLILASVVFTACGGDEEFSPVAEAVAAPLADAGFATDEVEAVSAFGSSSPVALIVEGGSIPDGQLVGVEFPETERDAERLAKQYENIDAEVVIDGTVVYSALKPADRGALDDVVEAAQD